MENAKPEVCCTSSNLKLPSRSNSNSNSKMRRAHKVNWTPTTEKETYSTVVVNYHFGKKEDRHHPHCTGAVAKKRNAWNKMLAAVTSLNVEEEDDVPNLSKLYEDSKEEPVAASADVEVVAAASQERLSKAAANNQVNTETVKVEMFCLPTQQNAIVEEPEVKTIQEGETTVVAGDVVPAETQPTKTIEEVVDEVNPPEPPVLYPEVIVISDDEEELVSEAPSSKSSTVHTKVENEQPVREIRSRPKSKRNDKRSAVQPATSQTKTTSNACGRELNKSKKTSRDSSVQPLKVKTQPQNGFKQRQLELHRFRIAVEQKRLELLEVKLARERDEMLREQVLFEKDLELRASQLKQLQNDKTVDIL